MIRGCLVATLLALWPHLSSAADPVEDLFAARGDWDTVIELNVGPGAAFSVFRPSTPGAGAKRHAVITWGNATLAVPLFYAALLDHLASHGFVVVASNRLFTGFGVQMRQALDWILEQDTDPSSPLFGTLETGAIGATGHSQGGGGAINAGGDPRVSCTAPIQPVPGAVRDLNGPMPVFTGTDDVFVPPLWVLLSVYLPSPVYSKFAMLKGGTHLDPLADGNGYRGYLTAWFAACLNHDTVAALAFTVPCTLCSNDRWLVLEKPARP